MENRITMKEFLETVAPYKELEISDLMVFSGNSLTGTGRIYNNYPNIEIECPICKGKRFFSVENSGTSLHNMDNTESKLIIYTCKNCNEAQKVYSLRSIKIEEENKNEHVPGKIQKLGEYPPFGDSIPTKVMTLVGKERDFFLKGRRCENQSLGIGAYAYYRRIVENQKDKLLDEIIKVCKKQGKQGILIQELENAKKETQFSKAIDSIKEKLPSSLNIEGQNPLKLLHKAVSKGIHNMTDEECLEYAESIRVILFELTERINAYLKESAEIHKTIDLLGSL